MPFVRKTDSQGSQPQTDTRKLFIGRRDELLFFVQNILKPEEPTHNIISIWGQGGVGKSTLLSRFIGEAYSAEFKDYCLTALVDERQTTPMSIMEKFATQLHMQGAFEKALKHYKEALRTQQTEREMLQDSLVQRMPVFAGAAVEGVPFVGPLLGEGVKTTTEHLMDRRYKVQRHKEAELLEDPVNALTRAFVNELNQLAETQVLIGSRRYKKQRLILFFDTFEQLAIEAAPWLLDFLLPADISSNIVLVIAGRDPIERSIPDDTKHWLPYIDDENIYWIPLNSFTKDETSTYLNKRKITDPERITAIWQLSQGLPLYLSLLTSNPHGKVDPTADVVANFLRWIPKEEQTKRKLALDASLFSKPFNQDDLAAFTYLSEQERPLLYHWLIGQPFVRINSQDGRYLYHDLARELFSQHMYQLSQKNYYDMRRILASYYEEQFEMVRLKANRKMYRLTNWLELLLALIHQLFALPDEGSHIKVIERLLQDDKHIDAEQRRAIVTTLREISQVQLVNQAHPATQQFIEYTVRCFDNDWNQNRQERLRAISFLIEKVSHEPTFPKELLARLYYLRGTAFRMLYDRQRAINDIHRALELLDSTAHTDRGWYYFSLHELQQAITEFDQALIVDPDDATAYSNRGWVYMNLKDYHRAIADFNQALRLDSALMDAYEGRGITYRRLKQYQLAIADFDSICEFDPHYHHSYLRLGAVYERMKDYDKAISYYNQALDLAHQPHDLSELYTKRGRCYTSSKMYKQASVDFNRALVLDAKNSEVYLQRGCMYLFQKNIKEAIVSFSKGWELDQIDLYCGLLAEWATMCQRRADEKMPERLISISADHPHTHLMHVCRGVAFWLQGRFEDALTEQAQAIPFWFESWGAYFWMGMSYASLNLNEEALESVEKAFDTEMFEMPPILLTPLRWFEQDRPDFYQKYVVPLLTRYDLV